MDTDFFDTKDLKDKISSLKTREGLKHNWPLFAVPLVFLIALYIRYIPSQGMQHLQALDSYWHLRNSQHFAYEFVIPDVDFMQFFPYNAPMYNWHWLDMVFPALMYWLGPFVIFGSYVEWAQFYPALMGAFGVVATYFLGKEVFDRFTGISAAFFLATIPGVLHRTSAGFFQKEPTATVFMVLSLYFFVKAWKNKSQISGILSGVFLGGMTLVWGGSQMLWLLYPLVVGLMLWINEDIENLVSAYTPMFIVAAGIGSVLTSRFWITDSIVLANILILGILWGRYLVEELNLVKQEHIGYFVPSVSILGLVALILSPLYSNFIARNFISLISSLEAQASSVVAGTVAENQPAGLGQLIGQLGAAPSAEIGFMVDYIPAEFGSIFSIIGNINGAWPLAFIGVVLIGTNLTAMVLKKTDIIEDTVEELNYFKLMLVVTAVWTAAFSFFFEASSMIAVAPAILGIVGGIGILYGLDELRDEVEIEFRWYYLLPLVWVVSNVLTAVNTSRIIFLAAFPVAFIAGYTFTKVVRRLNSLQDDSVIYLGIAGAVMAVNLVAILVLIPLAGIPIAIGGIAAVNIAAYMFFPDEWQMERAVPKVKPVKIGILTLVIGFTLVINFSAGYASAEGLEGSPNELWMENLEYMSDETPEGSVILSWWDYGYWFQTIGERASVADGGNNRYYVGDGERTNFHIADFLTSDDPENHTDLLERHSVDYLVLDETMIGKYSAVSQISNRDNENFNAMRQLETSRNILDSLDENRTLLTASGQGTTIFAPIEERDGSTRLSTDGERTPTLEIQSPRGSVRDEVGCVVTDEGVTEFENVEQPAELGEMGEVCIAENPYYSFDRAILTGEEPQLPSQQANLVLIPKEIAESNFVRLYFMDGDGIDYVEKVDGASNDFVKMWEVDGIEG